MTVGDPVTAIAALFASQGAAEYLDEPVSQAAHMLQAGSLTGHDLMHGTDNRHAENGAAWLARWFGEGVTEPVRLHVAAKRYLCAVEPDYAASLSSASVYTLGVQGGPMRRAEVAEFEAGRYAAEAVRVRRWDDAAKDPGAQVPGFDHYAERLRALLR